jgi:hypothetical protein
MGGISAVFTGGPDDVLVRGVEKTSYYTLTGEVGYPLGRRGLFNLKSGYVSGTADSTKFSRYYYEARLTYSLLRNLSIIAWWWQGKDSVETQGFDRKTRELEGRLYYRLRRVYLSLEYSGWITEEGPLTTKTSRLFLRLSRPI